MAVAVVATVVGTWELASYHALAPDGTRREGPLGPSPRGMLIYGADAHMSVSMMGTGGDGAPAFMGYAGTWRVDGDRLDQVVHEIAVASHGYMVGTSQVRDLEVDGDVLTLTGTTPPGAGPPERRVLTWRRAAAATDGQADGGTP